MKISIRAYLPRRRRRAGVEISRKKPVLKNSSARHVPSCSVESGDKLLGDGRGQFRHALVGLHPRPISPIRRGRSTLKPPSRRWARVKTRMSPEIGVKPSSKTAWRGSEESHPFASFPDDCLIGGEAKPVLVAHEMPQEACRTR